MLNQLSLKHVLTGPCAPGEAMNIVRGCMGGGYLEVGNSRFRGRQFVLLGEGGLVSPELPRQQGGEMLSRCLSCSKGHRPVDSSQNTRGESGILGTGAQVGVRSQDAAAAAPGLLPKSSGSISPQKTERQEWLPLCYDCMVGLFWIDPRPYKAYRLNPEPDPPMPGPSK